MSGASIAAEVAAAFAEAGVAVGNGTGAPTATISRPTDDQRITAPTVDYPNAAPFAPVIVPGTTVDHVFTCKPVKAEAAQKAGMSLEAQDRVFELVNHDVAITPNVSDTLDIDGVSWSVVEVMEKNPAGFVISWLARCKR